MHRHTNALEANFHVKGYKSGSIFHPPLVDGSPSLLTEVREFSMPNRPLGLAVTTSTPEKTCILAHYTPHSHMVELDKIVGMMINVIAQEK